MAVTFRGRPAGLQYAADLNLAGVEWCVVVVDEAYMAYRKRRKTRRVGRGYVRRRGYRKGRRTGSSRSHGRSAKYSRTRPVYYKLVTPWTFEEFSTNNGCGWAHSTALAIFEGYDKLTARYDTYSVRKFIIERCPTVPRVQNTATEPSTWQCSGSWVKDRTDAVAPTVTSPQEVCDWANTHSGKDFNPFKKQRWVFTPTVVRTADGKVEYAPTLATDQPGVEQLGLKYVMSRPVEWVSGTTAGYLANGVAWLSATYRYIIYVKFSLRT